MKATIVDWGYIYIYIYHLSGVACGLSNAAFPVCSRFWPDCSCIGVRGSPNRTAADDGAYDNYPLDSSGVIPPERMVVWRGPLFRAHVSSWEGTGETKGTKARNPRLPSTLNKH